MSDPTGGLDERIAPGEQIIWRGKPARSAFVLRTWPLSVFGAILVAAVATFVYTVLTTPAPDMLALVGIPLGLVALYMAVGHFVITSLEWKNTEYLVTRQQVLIKHGIFKPVITRFSLLGLPHTVVEMHGADVGNIMFKPREGHGYGPYPGYSTMWPYTPGYLLGFLYIHHPEEVQALIERARRMGPIPRE